MKQPLSIAALFAPVIATILVALNPFKFTDATYPQFDPNKLSWKEIIERDS